MWWCALALAQEPVAALTFRGGIGKLDLDVPEGYHVAADAPSRLTVGEVVLEATGNLDGVRFPTRAGPASLETGICADTSDTCRMVRLEGTVPPDARRVELRVPPPASPTAAATGAVVKVYDFTAVWCPPCNRMAAELFHDPADAAFMARWTVEPVDVDRPESWALKDRYAVGGYPTLVAVDARGAEVGRLVGYPGEAATRAWLEGLDRELPLHRLLAGVDGLDGAAAARAARRLAEARHGDAARTYLARAADGEDRRVASLLLDPNEADARWLFANAAPGDWIYAAIDAAPTAWPEALVRVAALPPVEAADALGLVADHLEAAGQVDAARAVRAGAVVALQGALTGDPELDRGHVTWLAELRRGVGDLDGALGLLGDYAARYPAEFTFDHAAARLLLDAGRNAEAEARARAALDKAWGDQRLRAAGVLARALAAQGRRDEAVAVLDAALAEVPEPAEGVEVRTRRYRQELIGLRDELRAKPR